MGNKFKHEILAGYITAVKGYCFFVKFAKIKIGIEAFILSNIYVSGTATNVLIKFLYSTACFLERYRM